MQESGSGRCQYTYGSCQNFKEALDHNVENWKFCLRASKGYILKVWMILTAECFEGDLNQSKQTKMGQE